MGEWRIEDIGETGGRAQPHRAAGLAVFRSYFGLDVINGAEQPAAACQQHLAGLGHGYAARAAFEQRTAKLALEFLDVPAECRLRDIERAGRSRESAAFGDRDEITKLPQVQFQHPSQIEIATISNIFL
jgi:hypothetical protein